LAFCGHRAGFFQIAGKRETASVIDMLQSLDVPAWNSLPLLSKICFAAAAVGLVLYIVLVIRGRVFGGDYKKTSE
jgi:hypothetical protein